MIEFIIISNNHSSKYILFLNFKINLKMSEPTCSKFHPDCLKINKGNNFIYNIY